MDISTAIWGAVIGGVIGVVTKEDLAKYALYGGGIGLGISLFKKDEKEALHRAGYYVGDRPLVPAFNLPTPSLPGTMDYNIDPRTDPFTDPVARRLITPSWLFAHWQSGDRKIIAEVQGLLGASPDGALGPGTASAIAAFQARAGLPQTGAMDVRTMKAVSGN